MLGDTIWAVASPPGSGERGIVRVSGPDAPRLAEAFVAGELPRARAAVEVRVWVGARSIEALVMVMPGPRSFTREDVAEFHLPGSAFLLERALGRLVELGARPAAPGEFDGNTRPSTGLWAW